MSVHDELLQTATGLEEGFKLRGKRETPQKYMSRLFGVLDYTHLPEEQWNNLSEPAQQWINDAQEAVDSGRDLPALEGLPEGEAEGGDDTKGDPVETKPKKAAAKKSASKKKANGAAPAKKAAATKKAAAPKKAAAAKKPEAPKKPKGEDSLTNIIRGYCVRHPGNEIGDVTKLLERKGLKASEGIIRTTRYWTNIVLAEAKEAGWTPPE